MKGILLAGGLGTRLSPITKIVSKQLLLVYDKPLFFYPLATLMLAGIKNIMVICTEDSLLLYKRITSDFKDFGVHLQFQIQSKPRGIPEGISLSRNFLSDENFALILGDNFFYGHTLGTKLRNISIGRNAHIFTCNVSDPENYGVANFDKSQNLISLEEKPKNPKSSNAITGLYFFPSDSIQMIDKLKISPRGELEIVDLLNFYLSDNRLVANKLPRGTFWQDGGSFDAILSISNYVNIVQKRQFMEIANLIEISWRNGWISDSDLIKFANRKEYLNQKKYLLELMSK